MRPSKIMPSPAGSRPLRYGRLVLPVLDASCVSCHSPQTGNEQAARPDFTPVKSCASLLTFGGEDLKKLAFERDRVGEPVEMLWNGGRPPSNS